MQDYRIMGVINVTPDSFSDGGQFDQTDKALKHALQLIEEGAHIIDIGGESTRPGADVVAIDEEIQRVVPVIEQLRTHNPDITISIDSSKAEVMQAAIAAGANFINDVNALQSPGCLQVAAESQLPVCLMHKQGQPKTMQHAPQYDDVVKQVSTFFKQRISECKDHGIESNNIILDPGIGFGKTLEHNLTLLKHTQLFAQMGHDVLIGVSRKTMIGQILNAEVDERLFGGLAVAQFTYTQGAKLFRVHDVKATADTLKMAQALLN